MLTTTYANVRRHVITACGLDEGETLGALLSRGPVGPALEHLFTDKLGYGWPSEDGFVNHFAAAGLARWRGCRSWPGVA